MELNVAVQQKTWKESNKSHEKIERPVWKTYTEVVWSYKENEGGWNWKKYTKEKWVSQNEGKELYHGWTKDRIWNGVWIGWKNGLQWWRFMESY